MKTEILIKELMRNHKEWLGNLSYAEYERIGEEEFSEWLKNKVRCVEVEQ